MIVVLSPNTAVDRVMSLPAALERGEVQRATDVVAAAGGKALNVARFLRQLGEPVRVVGFLGGAPRELIRTQCNALGIEQCWVETAGETRTCVIVAEPTSGVQTVLNEPGPEVSAVELKRLREEVARSVTAGDILAISGSLPRGAPDRFYADVVADMRRRGVRVLVDASGDLLRVTLRAHPWAATPNHDEYQTAFPGTSEPVAMARHLAQQTDNGLLTLGREGMLYSTMSRDEKPPRAASPEDGPVNGVAQEGTLCIWRLQPPPVQTLNAVGSGDAFVAGFLAGAERGLPLLEAARLGVAAGASNASHLAPTLGPPDEIDALFAAVHIEGTQ